MKQHRTSVCSCKIALRMGIFASVRQTLTRTAACVTRVWYSTCSTAVNRYARRYRSMWTIAWMALAVSIPRAAYLRTMELGAHLHSCNIRTRLLFVYAPTR